MTLFQPGRIGDLILKNRLIMAAMELFALVDPSLGRVVGPPTSSNRASSAHLRWEFAGSPGGGPPLQDRRRVINRHS